MWENNLARERLLRRAANGGCRNVGYAVLKTWLTFQFWAVRQVVQSNPRERSVWVLRRSFNDKEHCILIQAVPFLMSNGF
jgi:hypothetical protein